jgi:hypothetical protein
VSWLTVFSVEQNDDLGLFGARERLVDLILGDVRGEAAVEELAIARLLHDLVALVLDEVAEGVIAVDDGLLGHAGVANQKFSILKVRNGRDFEFKMKIS